MTKRKAKPTTEKSETETAPVAATPENPAENPVAATPVQIDVAQQQIAQRVRTEHAVLKQRFAEVDVGRTIAEAERDQLIQRLRASQQVIEQLTKELGEAQAAAPVQEDEEDEEPEEE